MVLLKRLDEIEEHAFPGGRGGSRLLLGLADGATQIEVHVNVLVPGGPPGPYHYHNRTENFYWILQGEGLLVAEGVQYRLVTDDIVFIPPGVKHSLSNVGEAELRLLEVYGPPKGNDRHLVGEHG